MTIRVLLTAVGIVLLLANPGWAQSTTTRASATIPTGNFDSLSPGNQKIANALFAAQKPTGTQTALTKDQIAGLRSTEGWGRVFKTMKADGLVQAKNLGQVVSGYQHSLRSSTTTAASRSARTTTTAGANTTRSGTTHASARSGSRFSAGSRFSSGGRFGSAGMTSGRGFAGGGRVATSAMGGGFGHGGMGGGGFGHGGGHGR